MLDPNSWTKFFVDWRKHKIAGSLAIVAILLIATTSLAVAGKFDGVLRSDPNGPDPTVAAASFTPSPFVSSSPTNTPTAPVPQPTPTPLCGVSHPANHASVNGSFVLEGRCGAYPQGTVFMILRDLHADKESGGPGAWWMQCKTVLSNSGEFVCSGFACIPGTEYEIQIIFPYPASYDAYDEWLFSDSGSSRYELPQPYEQLGPSVVIGSSASLRPTPKQCAKAEDDK